MQLAAFNQIDPPGGQMRETRTLSLRLSLEEYIAFDAVCREKGYSKT
jgi:hypothetical protein